MASINRRAVADEESFGRTAVPNPYTGTPQPDRGSWLADRMRRVVYIAISLYFLDKLAFGPVLLHSPHIRHEWFKVGLAATILILGIKAYVEMFEGHIKKQKVNYKNFKHSTHAAILLILLSSVAFNVALWPHYGWNTPIALGLAFFGVIVQLSAIVPTWIQNLATFVGLTFFLQQYQ